LYQAGLSWCIAKGVLHFSRESMNETRAGVRILLTGNNGFFREGLKALIEEQPGFSVIDEALDRNELVHQAELIDPDILLLETETLDSAGINILLSLRESKNAFRIILLVADIKMKQVSEAFKAGVQGIVLKESAANSLYKCIGAVMEGRYWVPDGGISDALHLLEGAPQSSKIKALMLKFGLTKREMQILALIVAGRTNLQIAKQFSISEQTVKHHVTNMFDKTGVCNRLELTLFAIHNGLITSAVK
jgi:two-component system, NarL family, nitrate/nitrite response regulator NarL